MSEHDELGAQVAVVKELLDPVDCKSKQAVAVTGEGGGPMMLRLGDMMTLERAKLASELAALLAQEADEEARLELEAGNS